MRIPSRRTFWLSAAIVLLAIVAWVLVPCNAINQKNYDRVEDGMTLAQIEDFLGEHTVVFSDYAASLEVKTGHLLWKGGPDVIIVTFRKGEVTSKYIHVASAWERLKWHAKNGAQKIGIEWQHVHP